MANALSIPHNQEAEDALLGAIIIDGKAISKIDLLPDAFFDETNRIIYQTILALYKDGLGIDQVSIADRLGETELSRIGGRSRLSHLVASVPYAGHPDYYADIIRKYKFSRDLIDYGTEVAAQAANDGSSPNSILVLAGRRLHELQLNVGTAELLTPDDVAELGIAHYQDLREKQAGFSTGMSTLDLVFGGFYPGEEIILAARPAVGKTTLALQLAESVAQSRKVLFCSLEMGIPSLIDKFVSGAEGVPIGILRQGQYSAEVEEKINRAMGKLSELQLYFYKGKGTTGDVRRAAEMMKGTYGLDLLVIDYLQLLRDLPTMPEVERITYISREITTLAKELNVTLLCLSQLSRALEGRTEKRPTLSDLRSSGAIEQDADAVLFLYREDYYDTSKIGPTELIIAKQRLGDAAGRKVLLKWKPIAGRYE